MALIIVLHVTDFRAQVKLYFENIEGYVWRNQAPLSSHQLVTKTISLSFKEGSHTI